MKILSVFLSGVFAFSLLPAADLPAVDIPKVTATSWPAEAYHAEVLKPLSAKPGAPARLSLGWNEKGLRIRVEAQDDTPLESPDEKSLWSADSLEIFVSSSSGGKDRMQIILSPGRPDGPPRFAIVDGRADKPPVTDPEISVQKTDKSYIMDVLVPWTNFLSPPKAGDVIALQIHSNDGVSPGKYARRIWYPTGGAYANSSLMHHVRLGGEASAPQLAASSLRVGRKGDVSLEITGAPALVGKGVEIEVDGHHLDAGILEAGGRDGSRLLYVLPADLASRANTGVQVYVAGNILLDDLVIPDVLKARRETLSRARVTAAPSVFHASAFPSIDFAERETADLAYGPYEITTRYFDATGNEVTEADKAGRYGALVTIRTGDGLEDTRRITLFKTPKPYSERLDTFTVRMDPPDAFDLSANIMQKETSLVQGFANGLLRGREANLAPFVAALQDIAADPAMNRGFDVGTLDADWWRMVEHKNGLARPYKYLVDLPKDYDADPKKSWPLLLFLHGSGERGDDLKNVVSHGPPKLIREGRDLPFVVVSPLCPAREWWCPDTLLEVLDEVAEKYRIDPKKIYVTGLSMGGYGAWSLVARHPERFAAVAPICGGAYPELAPRLAHTPAWVFHGDKDSAVPISQSEGIVKSLNNLRAPVKFTVYPGVEHDSWTRTYDNPDLYTWLLEQSR